MEINPSNIEKSEEIVWSSDGQGLGQVRSYTCTFCKRGFLNAQALGGHMNIHRKDRARLKESSSTTETLISEDVSKKNPSDHPDPGSADDNPLQHEAIDEKIFALKRPWVFSEEDGCSPRKRDGSVGELPLFVETPATSDDQQASVLEIMELGRVSELDLELRLGSETSTKGTREHGG